MTYVIIEISVLIFICAPKRAMVGMSLSCLQWHHGGDKSLAFWRDGVKASTEGVGRNMKVTIFRIACDVCGLGKVSC